MVSIEQSISQLRDLINKPRKQHLLLKDSKLWNQLCSSLDVVQDTDLALDSYLEKDFSEDIGDQYLRVYGVLQVLIVQQDAVKHLVESLSLPRSFHNDFKDIYDIRDIRIKAIGHPTKKEKGRLSYHFISRATMHKNGFQLMSCFPDDKNEFTDVNIPELISRQRGTIKVILKAVFDELKKEEQEHKEKFRDE